MKYSDSVLNQVMAILENKMEEFRNPKWGEWSEYERMMSGVYDRKWDLGRFQRYIESLGGSLLEDYCPPHNDDLDDEEWEALCDRRLAEIEAETGMFPVLLPRNLGKYRACLLPPELVGKILALGMFP